ALSIPGVNAWATERSICRQLIITNFRYLGLRVLELLRAEVELVSIIDFLEPFSSAQVDNKVGGSFRDCDIDPAISLMAFRANYQCVRTWDVLSRVYRSNRRIQHKISAIIRLCFDSGAFQGNMRTADWLSGRAVKHMSMKQCLARADL